MAHSSPVAARVQLWKTPSKRARRRPSNPGEALRPRTGTWPTVTLALSRNSRAGTLAARQPTPHLTRARAPSQRHIPIVAGKPQATTPLSITPLLLHLGIRGGEPVPSRADMERMKRAPRVIIPVSPSFELLLLRMAMFCSITGTCIAIRIAPHCRPARPSTTPV